MPAKKTSKMSVQQFIANALNFPLDYKDPRLPENMNERAWNAVKKLQAVFPKPNGDFHNDFSEIIIMAFTLQPTEVKVLLFTDEQILALAAFKKETMDSVSDEDAEAVREILSKITKEE